MTTRYQVLRAVREGASSAILLHEAINVPQELADKMLGELFLEGYLKRPSRRYKLTRQGAAYLEAKDRDL